MMIVVMVMAVGDDDGGGDGGWWRLHICGDCGDVSQCTALLVVQSIYKNAYPMYGAKFTMSAAKIQTKYAHRVAFGPMPLWNLGGSQQGASLTMLSSLLAARAQLKPGSATTTTITTRLLTTSSITTMATAKHTD